MHGNNSFSVRKALSQLGSYTSPNLRTSTLFLLDITFRNLHNYEFNIQQHITSHIIVFLCSFDQDNSINPSPIKPQKLEIANPKISPRLV